MLRQKDQRCLRDEERFTTTGVIFLFVFLKLFPDIKERVQKKSDSEAPLNWIIEGAHLSQLGAKELVTKVKSLFSEKIECPSIHHQAKRNQINDNCQWSR